jgi:quinol monooxygenase YgiN
MAPLTIIATWKAKPGAEDELYERCRGLLAETRTEEGCINYDLYRSIEDPGTMIFYENWTTKPLWEQHINAPHISQFFNSRHDVVESFEIFQGEKAD